MYNVVKLFILFNHNLNIKYIGNPLNNLAPHTIEIGALTVTLPIHPSFSWAVEIEEWSKNVAPVHHVFIAKTLTSYLKL